MHNNANRWCVFYAHLIPLLGESAPIHISPGTTWIYADMSRGKLFNYGRQIFLRLQSTCYLVVEYKMIQDMRHQWSNRIGPHTTTGSDHYFQTTFVSFCDVLRSWDGRRDGTMCENNYHYRPGLWDGRVDQQDQLGKEAKALFKILEHSCNQWSQWMGLLISFSTIYFSCHWLIAPAW